RAEIAPGRRAVLAGMGFIGSEVAASLRSLGVEVTVVAGGVAPLDRVLGEDIGRVLEGIHRDHGVTMHFGQRVAGPEGGGRVAQVVTAGGGSVDRALAALRLGVEPATGLAAAGRLHGRAGRGADEWR